MANVRLHKDAINPMKSEHYAVGSVNLLSWLEENAPWADLVVRNGNQIHIDDADVTLSQFDEVDVYKVPQGADPVSWLVIVLVNVGLAVAAYLLTPRPELPNGGNQGKSSPNNQLNAANNEFRRRQALPNIYGQQVSYADFLQPSYYEYIDNVKTVTELFNIGVDYHTVTDGKSSDTPLPSSSWTIYQPGDELPPLLNYRGATESNNVTVLAPNDPAAVATITEGRFLDGTDQINTGGNNLVDNIGLEVGDEVDVDLDYDAGGGDIQNFSGIYEVTAIGVGGTLITLNTDVPFSEIGSVNGTIKNLDSPATVDRWFTLSGSDIEQVWFQIVAPRGVRSAGGEFLTINLTLTVERLDGSGDPTGDTTTSLVEFAGNTIDEQFKTFKITGLTPARYRARVIRTTDTQPQGASDLIKIEDIASVREYNVTNKPMVTATGIDTFAAVYDNFTQAEIDALELEVGDQVRLQVPAQSIDIEVSIGAISSVEPISITFDASTGSSGQTNQTVTITNITKTTYSEFGSITAAFVERSASTFLANQTTSKINFMATRELPIFDPVTATFGARAATRSFAQAVMHVLYTLNNVPLSKIDYERLFEIEDSLSDPELGYFDFTFDDKDISTGEMVATILNVARCYHWVTGDIWNFERDEAKPVRTMLFNRRNCLPEAAEQSYTLYRSAEYDSVEVRYVDPDTNSDAYVRRRINSTTGAIEEGAGDYVNEIVLAGCRNSVQATDRAELEIRKIKYLWLQVKDTVTSEGLTVGLGQRVGWVDINDSEVFDGEILEVIGGGEYRLSEKWDYDAGETYYVYIIQSDGTVSSQVEVTQPVDFDITANGIDTFATAYDNFEASEITALDVEVGDTLRVIVSAQSVDVEREVLSITDSPAGGGLKTINFTASTGSSGQTGQTVRVINLSKQVGGDTENKYRMVAPDLTGVVISDGYERQQGSLYVIAKLDSLNARDFTITSRGKPDERYNVPLEMVNYDERVYEMDA